MITTKKNLMKFILKSIWLSFLLFSTQIYAAATTYSVEVADEPLGFIISKDDSRAYVTTGRCELQSGGEVDALDLKSLKVIARIKVPACLYKDVFLTKDEKTLYVNYGQTIAIIDVAKFKIVKRIQLKKYDGFDSVALMSPDKSKIYYHIMTRWDETDYAYHFLVVDTKTNEIIDKIPNAKAVCDFGCSLIMTSVMSPDGHYIYEMPSPYYKTPQKLFSLNVTNKKMTLLGSFNARSVYDALFLTKDGKTFYNTVYETDHPTDEDPTDWYIHAIDKESIQFKELYHAEHKIKAIGLSEEKRQLYILHLRDGHKAISTIDIMTGNIVSNIAMPNTIIEAKMANPKLSDIYFTTMPGGGSGSLFNIMKFE
jgi:hypothetical protein